MSQNPGPRDWTPSSSAGAGWGGGARGRTTIRESVLSLVLGLLALGLGLIPYTEQHVSLVFSSVGISAIAAGVVALTRLRGAGLAHRLVPMLGVTFGGFGTVLMLLGLMSGHSFVTTTSPLGVPAPLAAPLPTTVASAPPAPARTPAPASTPAPPLNLILAQYAGTVVHLLQQQHAQFGTYPTAMNADTTGMVVTMTGTVRLPVGAMMSYVPWPDGSGYELHLVQGTAVIAYSSAIGQLEWVSR